MEAEKDKLFDHFKNKKTSQTTFGFTESVMDRIDDIVSTPFVVKPLISKKGWIYILIVMVLVVLGSFMVDLMTTFEKMPKLFELPKIQMKDFETSLRVVIGVAVLLLALTLADIVYRKSRRMV